MRIRVGLAALIATGTAIALAAGASAYGSAVQFQPRLALNETGLVAPTRVEPRSPMARADSSVRRRVFISDAKSNTVSVFTGSGTLLRTLTGFNAPGGLLVDAHHNLWVSNTNGLDVLVFAPESTVPFRRLSDPGYPIDVAVCPNGTVYVSNIFATPGLSPGNIEVYAPGATLPTRSLQFPNEGENRGITCDAANNVFTTIYSDGNSAGIVVEYARGATSGTQLPIGLLFPGGIKVASDGNLLVGDLWNLTITKYSEAGMPVGGSIRVNAHCEQFDVTHDDALVGCSGGVSAGQAYAFPGGTPLTTYSEKVAGPWGFAYEERAVLP